MLRPSRALLRETPSVCAGDDNWVAHMQIALHLRQSIQQLGHFDILSPSEEASRLSACCACV